MLGTIFDIKRFAVHDGPGIRTTIFFKGCPLHCPWCHNPEGISTRLELMVRPDRCAAACHACLDIPPKGAFRKTAGRVVVERSAAGQKAAAKASEACLYEALQLIGRKVTVDDLVSEIEKDRIFYEQSGGGVTLSGGEPLLQHAFAGKLIDTLRERGIPVALDTSGLAPFDILEKIALKCALVLFDLKHMDDAAHRRLTGVSNRRILENLQRLTTLGLEIWVRIPLVTGVNDDERNIGDVVDFLEPLKNISRVSLLPYHKGGCEKARNLGQGEAFETFEVPSPTRLEAIAKSLAGAGYEVKIGG